MRHYTSLFRRWFGNEYRHAIKVASGLCTNGLKERAMLLSVLKDIIEVQSSKLELARVRSIALKSLILDLTSKR